MAVADVRHASPNSQTLGTAVSLGAHGILFGILLFGITRAPGVGDTVAVRIERFHPEFLNKPGPGATGTSSGSGVTDPPRRPPVNDVPQVSFVDIPVPMLEPVQILLACPPRSTQSPSAADVDLRRAALAITRARVSDAAAAVGQATTSTELAAAPPRRS